MRASTLSTWTDRRRSTPGCSISRCVHTDQLFSNCPKYIHVRAIEASNGDAAAARPAVTTGELTIGQQRWITGADTFLIATHAPGQGADVSHRGGNPGFVNVLSPRRLVWPDYAGNSMYMTLGNLAVTPDAGPLFLDWQHGHILQLTGQAQVDWDPDHAAAVPGALRLVEFEVNQVVQTPPRHLVALEVRRVVPAQSSGGRPPDGCHSNLVKARSVVGVSRMTNRCYRLRRLPIGLVTEDDLEFLEEAVPDVEPGQALVRTLWLSVDPANRMDE
jgi:predicted pyridoxine 5'-phosphate oxidase superfamily flavin-nucleotide-binding protein